MAMWAAIIDLGLGRRCLRCEAPGAPWCDRCVRSVYDPHLVKTPAGRRVHASADYAHEVRSAVLGLKEGGQLALARPLGRLLAAGVDEVIGEVVGELVGERGGADAPRLAAAPSRRAAVRRRGHDHAAGLAREAGRWCVRPVAPTALLSWGRQVADQGDLDAAQRAGNVSGGMVARRAPRPGSPVVVVDDLVTTGATLDEAHRALEEAGWCVLGSAVVASVATRWGVARARRLG